MKIKANKSTGIDKCQFEWDVWRLQRFSEHMIIQVSTEKFLFWIFPMVFSNEYKSHSLYVSPFPCRTQWFCFSENSPHLNIPIFAKIITVQLELTHNCISS